MIQFWRSLVKEMPVDSVIGYMGRRTRIFVSLYLGFAVYCALVLFFGRTGIVATSELKHYRSRLDENLTQLEHINRQLADHFDALRGNPETIRLEARQLGYLEPDQRIIQVTGYSPTGNSFAVGSLLGEKKHTVTSDSISRIVGFSVAILSFILIGLFVKGRDGPETK
ncbi:MAG TPA: septum formation initiator family protein [Spirochaetia bacterium]|nr:septum formation initiator family protein [Spirochaetia bacterium]